MTNKEWFELYRKSVIELAALQFTCNKETFEKHQIEYAHKLFKAIQLDAHKQGMTDAAEIADKIEQEDGENYGIESAILSARDNKTTI